MKLVIFDYDGVLVDSFEATMKIYLDISNEFKLNLPESPEYFKELFELDWRETIKKLKLYEKKKLDKINEIYINGLKKYDYLIKPYPNINHVLEKLSEKYTLAVASNNIRQELEYRLNKFNLIKYFTLVLGEEDGELKPSPDLLLKCMKRLNASPKETSFIGDMDGDIKAGRAAKIGKIIAVTYGFHEKHKIKDADVIVETPEELLDKLF